MNTWLEIGNSFAELAEFVDSLEEETLSEWLVMAESRARKQTNPMGSCVCYLQKMTFSLRISDFSLNRPARRSF